MIKTPKLLHNFYIKFKTKITIPVKLKAWDFFIEGGSMRITGSRNCLFALTLLAFVSYAKPLAATPELGFGARDAALGGAMTALADDAESSNYNPAGLAHLIQNQASASYGFLNSGIPGKSNGSDWAVNCGVPLSRRFGALGLTWKDTTERGQHREQMASLDYGRYILGRFAVGMGTRYLNRNTLSSTLGIDLGILAQFGTSWTAGFSAQGVNDPEQSAHFNNKGTLRYGAAYRRPAFSVSNQFNVARSSDGYGRDVFMTAAFEKWWLARQFLKSDVALRGSFSIGTDESSQMNGGISFRARSLQFDYAFMLPVRNDRFKSARPSQRLSLSYWFGQSAPSKKSAVGKGTLNRLIALTRQEIDFHEKQAENGIAQAKSLKSVLLQQTNEAKNIKDIYRLAMSQYWSKKDQGAALSERIEILRALIDIFLPRGISTMRAEYELSAAKWDWALQEQKWAEARGEYTKRAVDNEAPMDRIKILMKCARKYAPTGHSMDFVIEELAVLERFNE